tara:strand:- start:377 stop:577 length:201 start_codon:yes stop_codon:yes gene_type:complete
MSKNGTKWHKSNPKGGELLKIKGLLEELKEALVEERTRVLKQIEQSAEVAKAMHEKNEMMEKLKDG